METLSNGEVRFIVSAKCFAVFLRIAKESIRYSKSMVTFDLSNRLSLLKLISTNHLITIPEMQMHRGCKGSARFCYSPSQIKNLYNSLKGLPDQPIVVTLKNNFIEIDKLIF